MSKLPQWMSRTVSRWQTAPKTLQDAAKVIRQDAKAYRMAGDKDAANVCMLVAQKLDEVANGDTWQGAFEL